MTHQDTQMTNIYISDIVGDDGFYSSASSVYMEMLIIYLVEDPRYINRNDAEFELNMINFIYGDGQ